MKWLCVLFVLIAVCLVNSEFSEPQNVTSPGPCTDTNHLFLAPGVLTAGGTNRACVSRFFTEGPARMVVALVAEDVQAASASRELPPGDGGCIDIAVPQKPNTKAKLVVQLWYPEAKCSWERELSVLISGGRVIVVQVERARYRPGDTLRARIVALKPDLAPAHGMIDEVWLEGPQGAWEGSRAAQWQRVRSRMGIAQVQHELDELAPAGLWTVRAKLADGSQGSSVFWVGNYELPPFQLSVRHASRVLRTSERLVWTVCVRYPWTEAVEGMLVIRIRGAGGTSVGQEARSNIRTVVRIRAPRACHRHAAAARRVGLNQTDKPDVIVADFSFQEDGTRIWQNTTVVSHVVDKPVTLEFLRKLRAVISPGLPYKLKVKATRWDDKPAGNERVRVCRSSDFAVKLPHATNDTCQDAVTDDRGIARVTFTANEDGSRFYSFQASLQNDSSVSAPPLHLPARHAGSVHAALGTIKPDANSAKTFVPLYVNLRNVSRPLTVHFVVITRGGIIYRWGATTQCPQTSSSDYIPTTSRNAQCNNNVPNNYVKPILYRPKMANKTNESINETDSKIYQANFESTTGYPGVASNQEIAANILEDTANNQENTQNQDDNANNEMEAAKSEQNDPDSLLDRHLLRVMLPIKVTHQMCPDSHLVAYFYLNGELVSASKQFEMDECFSNKVEATWLSRQVAPGSQASLRVSTPGPALCALTALDSASKWTQPAPSVKDLVMVGLKRLMDSHRNLTEYEAAGSCFKTSDILEQPSNSLEQTATWLAAAGVRVTGGDLTDSRSCATPPAPLMDDTTVPRSDFSEAWLWRLAPVGTNGTSTVSARAPDSISRFEAMAVCLARNGISVSPPAVLQVFREFFIHADGPRRLRRGDASIVRYRLFNYLYEPISVQIQILTDAHLEGPVDHAETVCVAGRASVARRAEVHARVQGQARLAIRAKSVRASNCGKQTHPSPVSDEVIMTITVEPEGVPVQEHKSVLLCGRGSPESSLTDVSWSWPSIQPVPGTETLSVWAMGDIKGPLLFDADSLVTLPRGCGEQNMARLAANLLALTQLAPDCPTAAMAKEHVSRGFTRQLQYIHPSGGFSAFGSADAAPSTWLTAFSLKYLRRAHQVLNPDLPLPPALEKAERWLLNQQMENGCFRNEGQVFHRELKGGLNEEGEIASVALTAYVITALVDSTAPLPARVLHNTLACLRALPPMKTRTPTRVYANSLLGYAFMRLRNYEDELRKTNEASLLWDKKETAAGLKVDEELRELMELLKIAKRSGDYVWWETSSLSTSVEATAYALLALSYCPPQLRSTSCAADARAAIRWLSAHRNSGGGFLSTQDTLVALEALSRWSSVQPSLPPNLTVRLKSGGDLKKISIQPDIKVPEVTRITGKSQVDVSVEGTGCALIQATRSYNTLASDQPKNKQLTVQASVHTDGVFDCDLNRTSCFCAAVVEVCVSWTGVFPAMALVEATLPAGFGADASRLYEQLEQPDTLVRRIELTPNGGRATLYLSARSGTEAAGGHRCFPVASVGPRARTKPAHVRVIDYYAPDHNDTQMYTIPEDCPPRIAHSANDYHSSDNLYNKAKSLTDSGEILISHEYSFEDIPEGIPLEDPLYDLNRDDIGFLTKYKEVPQAKNNTVNDLELENNETTSKAINSATTSKVSTTKSFRENINENTIANTDVETRLKVTSNEARIPNNDNRSNMNRKDGRQRKGHSIPFLTNYPRRNLFEASRVNAFSDYYRPSIDQSHLHPEQIFYEYNPYLRRIAEENSDFQYFQAVKTRPYDETNFGQYRQDYFKPFVASNERINQQTYENSRVNNDMTLQHYTETNFYPNIQYNDPSQYYQPSTGPLLGQKENIIPKHITTVSIPNITTLEYKTTTPIYSTSKPFDLRVNEKTSRVPVANPNDLSFHRAISNTSVNRESEVNAQTENPSFNISSTQFKLPNSQPPDLNIQASKETIIDSKLNDFNASKDNSSNPDFNINVSSDNPIASHNDSRKHNPDVFTNTNLNNKTGEMVQINNPGKNTSLQNFDPNIADNNPNVQLPVSQHRPVEKPYPSYQNPNPPYNQNPLSFDLYPSDSVPDHSNYNHQLLGFDPSPSSSSTNPLYFNPNPSMFNHNPANHNPSSTSHSNLEMFPNKETQKVASQVDNPNLSGFHVIDSEADLEVPSGLEGPVPSVVLPPQNFVAVAPPPGFQPPFIQGEYPRLYPLPPRQYRYYRHVPAG